MTTERTIECLSYIRKCLAFVFRGNVLTMMTEALDEAIEAYRRENNDDTDR